MAYANAVAAARPDRVSPHDCDLLVNDRPAHLSSQQHIPDRRLRGGALDEPLRTGRRLRNSGQHEEHFHAFPHAPGR